MELESASDLKLGVLMIFAEAQAWAHGLLSDDMTGGVKTSAHLRRVRRTVAERRAREARNSKNYRARKNAAKAAEKAAA